MTTDTMTGSPPWAGLQLDRLDALGRRIFDAAWALGYEHGVSRGYELAEADMAAAWSEAAKTVHSVAKSPTFEQLLARRRVDRTDAHPVPSVEDCRRSWVPALADYARRHGATEQEVARLVIAEQGVE